MQNKGMAKRISETEAVQIMRNGGLEPIVPFKTNDSPGNQSV